MAEFVTRLMPALTGLLYLIAAVAFVADNRYSWGLVYFAYAVANIGLILAAIS